MNFFFCPYEPKVYYFGGVLGNNSAYHALLNILKPPASKPLSPHPPQQDTQNKK